jgi:uncharacterized protein YciI
MAQTEETWLLLYQYVENMTERRTPHRQAHLAHLLAEREAGHLLVAGAYGEPVQGGAIGFRGVTREHVENWVAGDPYKLADLVVSYEIHRWNLV